MCSQKVNSEPLAHRSWAVSAGIAQSRRRTSSWARTACPERSTCTNWCEALGVMSKVPKLRLGQVEGTWDTFRGRYLDYSRISSNASLCSPGCSWAHGRRTIGRMSCGSFGLRAGRIGDDELWDGPGIDSESGGLGSLRARSPKAWSLILNFEALGPEPWAYEPWAFEHRASEVLSHQPWAHEPLNPEPWYPEQRSS